MRPNPFRDVVAFLSAPSVATVIFWLLLLGGCAAAAVAWRADPGQRTAQHVGVWLFRVLVGSMWWQGSLWKIPPDYNGLIYWLKQMVDHASIALQAQLVQNLVLPNITIFGPLVYGVEVFIGASFLLGLLTRVGAVLGALMTFNLWLGLYSAPNEWPWTYGFLLIIQVMFTLHPPGRSLGADFVLRQRYRLSTLLS